MKEEFLTQLPDHLYNPDPNIYLSDNYGVIDFETTNLDKGSFHNKNNNIVSVSLWDNYREKAYTEMVNQFEVKEYLGDLSRFDYWVAHNANFEWGWLWVSGYELGATVSACTQIAEYTLAGNRPWGQYASLDGCLARRGLPQKKQGVSRMIKAGINPADIPAKYLLPYNTQDVIAENRLWRHQRAAMALEGLLPAYYTKNLYTPVLVDLERYGLHLDKQRVEYAYDSQSEELRHLEIEWNTLTGGVNPKSSKQKIELFYDKLNFKVPSNATTEKGAPKTDSSTLSRLVATTEEQRRCLSLVKAISGIRDNLSKILSKFYNCVTEGSGTLKFKINQTATRTHRLSSTGREYTTQGQNIHRSFKPLICSRNEGWSLAEIDQDGLEFRVAGHLARDAQVKEDILGGKDPHEMSGKIVFKDEWNFSEGPKSNSNKLLRQNAKAYTFKPLYGGSKGTPEEMEYYAEFRRHYKGVSHRQERWVDEVIANGYLVNETGLRFYWDDTVRFGNGSARNFQAICNYPVQYFATGDSGIVPIAVIYQWHMMKVHNTKSFLCNTVHDSSIGEVHPEEKALYKEIAEWAFTDNVNWYLKKVYNIDLFIPVAATVEYHDHWNDSPEWREEWLNG